MKISGSGKLLAVAVGIAFVSSMTGYLFGVNADNREPSKNIVSVPETKKTQAQEKSVEVSENINKAVSEVPKKYVLKEYNGGVSLLLVNSNGEETVYKNYDININTLPSVDREKLREGIVAESLSEALQMVEDYF